MKKTVALIACATLIFGFISPANATTLTNANAATNPIFIEDGSEVLIGEGITFTTDTSFTGGSLEFSVGSAGATDILNLQKVNSAITTNGVVSVVGSTIYKGDGTNANPVASIDATKDGSSGENLKINFSSAFTNAGFESGDFTGWTYFGNRVDIGVTTLAGVVSNDSSNQYIAASVCNAQGVNDNDAPASATYSYQFATDKKTEGSKSLRLFSTMTTLNGGDVVHGPAVVSDEFTAAANDVIKFDWIAASGGDDFDAYGYLINSATGQQIEVIDANGSGTSWATKSTTIPATGNYRFVFINGTHDLSCGRAAGGSLYIDNIVVTAASVGIDLAQAISRLVTYKSTSNNPGVSKTVTLTATPASGSITPLSITVDITNSDDGPVPADISISYSDTSANDDFSDSSGTISVADPDGGAGGGSVAYGITGGTSSGGSTSKVGTYGTLSVNETTGAYSYAPNDSAINNLIINASETFTITANNGLSGSGTITVSITATGESATSVPTIASGGLSPSRGSNAGGTTVTITGTGFSTAQFVKFGTTYGTNLVIISDTSLTVTSPAKLAGEYNVTVLNNGGVNSGTNNFTYYIPSAPSAPTGVSATGGDASALVSWTASTDTTSYTVTSNPGSLTCTTALTSCTVSGLTNGTAYTFTVVASNSAGSSSPSSASSAVTPALSLPSSPTGVSGTSGDTSVVVAWTASSGATSYTVTSNPGSFTCSTTLTTCTVSGLTNGTAYTFTVIATNSAGDSLPSTASSSITPTAPAPTTPSTPTRTQSQETVNKQLAEKITVVTPKENVSEGKVTGPITIAGISNNAQIFVKTEDSSKLNGFSNLVVSQNSIQVIPKETFSGKMVVPVTISENGATITLNVDVVVNPKPVEIAKTQPIARNQTQIEWVPSPNAESYQVLLNGKSICDSSGSTCNVPKLLGPKSNLKVVSLGNDGTISTQVIPAYTPSKPIPVLDVKFSTGSASISKSEVSKLKTFVKVMKEQGFSSVKIAAFTDSVGGQKGANALSTARAISVKKYLSRFLDVKINSSGNGIAPEAMGTNKSKASARKAQISVL